MKTKLITLFLSTALTVPAFCQDKITVSESRSAMSKGTHPSFTAEIPGAKLKDVQKDWKKYISDGSKGKVLEANDEISIAGAMNKNISSDPFNVYSRLLETPAGVKVTAWLNFNDSIYISKEWNNDKDIAAQKYILDFCTQQYREVVKDQLNTEKQTQKKMQGELKDLIKEEEKANKKIEEYQRSIEKNNTGIITNDNDQKRKMDLISNQKGMVESTRDNIDANKDAQKTLKDMEGELKKLQKEGEKLNKEIDKWNRDIREEQRKIEAGKQDQRLKIEQIEKQKQVVQSVEDKLKNI